MFVGRPDNELAVPVTMLGHGLFELNGRDWMAERVKGPIDKAARPIVFVDSIKESGKTQALLLLYRSQSLLFEIFPFLSTHISASLCLYLRWCDAQLQEKLYIHIPLMGAGGRIHDVELGIWMVL